MRMFAGGRSMLVSLLAMFVSRVGVLFRLFVLAKIMMVGSLMVMMCGSVVMSGSLMMCPLLVFGIASACRARAPRNR
jgi:hypothetical protein